MNFVLYEIISLTFSFPFFSKLKVKQISFDARIFLSRVNPAIKPEEIDTCWLVQHDLWQEFYHKSSFFNFYFSSSLKIKMLLCKPHDKLRPKRVSLDASTFMSWADPLNFRFACCINVLCKFVRFVGVLYDVLYFLCCINLFLLYACCKKQNKPNHVLYFRVVFSCDVFVLYFLCCILVSYFSCCISVLYLRVIYFWVAFPCCIFLFYFLYYIFCVVLYVLYFVLYLRVIFSRSIFRVVFSRYICCVAFFRFVFFVLYEFSVV